MQPNTPQISVLMAAFNAAKYLNEAVDDLLRQTFSDFELVIVEDGSSDETLAILRKYVEQDRRVVLIENERNLGLPASLNRGLAVCRAPIVARADADDRYMPDRLKRQLSFLEQHPEVGLVSCAVEKIDEEGRSLFETYFPTTDGEIRMRELFVNCFSHPGAMFRRDLVQGIGGYNTSYTNCEDADLWARLRRRTRAANLDVPLVRYRKHSQSIMQSRSSENEKMSLTVRQRALEDYLGRPVSADDAHAMVYTFWPQTTRKLTEPQLRAGIRGLREVLARAKHCESSETVAYYTGEVYNALVAHARRSNRGKMMRWALIAEATRWLPFESLRRIVAKSRMNVFRVE